MDSYLEIARKILREARQPLNAREILKAAYQRQIVPRDLYGRTQHKTLQARLSTDILKRKSASDFYRTAPGRFFLRVFQGDRSMPSHYRREYIAPLRAAQLGRFEVLTFLRTEVRRVSSSDSRQVALGDLMSLHWQYCRMEDVRRDPSRLAFRFVVVIVDDGRVVLNQRRPSGDGELSQRTTLGFEGVVRREDRSLFSAEETGLLDAAVRTLMQCLALPSSLMGTLEDVSRWSVVTILFEERGAPKVDDLAAILSFRCFGIPEVVDAIEDLATSDWLKLPIRVNDFDRFDRWSVRLIEDASLQRDAFDGLQLA